MSMRRRLQHGFSLIEAMVAGAILAIVLTSTAGALGMAFRFVAERRFRATAEVVGDPGSSVVFFASCRIIENTPATPGRLYDRLMVDVVVDFEGRGLKSSYATYVVHR